MPKRPCPFEEDLLPQVKVHVGQKEVNNGVGQEERMKLVYGKIEVMFDRTMDLLKDGVKALSQKMNNSMDLNPMDIPESKSLVDCKMKNERNSKQMVLNCNLGLLGADKAIQDTKPKYDLCDCTRVIDQNMFNKCYYCDQVLCNSCLSKCVSCSELFCQNCSLPTYDQEEASKCLNCYK